LVAFSAGRVVVVDEVAEVVLLGDLLAHLGEGHLGDVIGRVDFGFGVTHMGGLIQ
jgi:hypothetical protein